MRISDDTESFIRGAFFDRDAGNVGRHLHRFFPLVIVAMHVLSPDIDRVNRPTSDYATGPFGYVMTSGFIALSIATWSLVIGLHRSLSSHGAQRAGPCEGKAPGTPSISLTHPHWRLRM